MDSETINRLLEKVCQEIGGEWILLGATLLSVSHPNARSTEDIDLVAIKHSQLSDVALMSEFFKKARELGLEPEQVNSAAGFFLRQCKGWEQDTTILSQSKIGTIHRPKLSLYLALKLNRGTELDIKDATLAVEKFGKAEFSSEHFFKWANEGAKKIFEKNRVAWEL